MWHERGHEKSWYVLGRGTIVSRSVTGWKMAIESGVYVVVVDSHAHFEAPGFQSTASIPPICDIPLTEVNRRLYGTQCRTDGLHLD